MTITREKFLSFRNKKFLALLVGVISFLVYCNTIPNFYNLDDELITENHILTGNSFSTFQKIFTEPYYQDKAGNKYEYRPVVLMSYFFEFLLFGRNPHVSHFINVILFSATCILLFYLLVLLFGGFIPEASLRSASGKQSQDRGTGWMGMPAGMMIPMAITLLFAVHPLHTEVVASIKNRDEILALLFGLLSWFFALRFIDSKNIAFYLLYVLFFVTGLFSKQTSIAFAILIPVSIIMFRQVAFHVLVALILPIQLISAIFSPIYLIYKKIALFFVQIIFLVLFYYFIAKREMLIDFIKSIFMKIRGFFIRLWMLIRRYFKAYSISISNGIFQLRVNYKLLLGTILSLVIIAGAINFLVKKKEEVKKAQWNVKDTFHDFNELQVVPAMATPAPTVIPIAGRKLNYVELPLLYEENRSIKVGTSLFVLGRYLKLMFIPQPLRYYYGYGLIPMTDFGDMRVPLSLGIHIALFLLMFYFLMVRKHFIAAFGILFYLLSIVPLSNMLTPIAGVMAERLAFTPSVGFCIAFCYLLIYPRMAEDQKLFGINYSGLRRPLEILLVLMLLVFAAMTVSRNFYWKDHVTLMRHDIAHMRKSARGHHLLASHLAVKASERKQHKLPENRKLLEEALVHFKKTVEIYEEYPKIWYDMAKIQVLLGDNNKAIDAYTHAIKADSIYAPSCFELGILLEEAKRTREAEEAYRLAIARDSLFLQAYINLSFLYYKENKYPESLAVNLEALKHLPGAYELYSNTGRIYLVMQDIPQALEYLEKAVAINPSDKSMLKMMGDLYERMGNVERAMYYRNLK